MLLSNGGNNPAGIGLSAQEQERVARIGDELREGIECSKPAARLTAFYSRAETFLSF